MLRAAVAGASAVAAAAGRAVSRLPSTAVAGTATVVTSQRFASSGKAAHASETGGQVEQDKAGGDGAGIPAAEWSASSRRVGLVGVKLGMLPYWDEWGKRHPATVVHFPDNVVVSVKDEPVKAKINPKAMPKPTSRLVVAAAKAKDKHVNKPQRTVYAKAGLEPRRKMVEFAVSDDAVLPVGTELSAAHLLPGQYVDVRGVTRGKGFAGVMKRYNFKGQSASHGTSVAHRHGGSTGGSQGPGKVWKNKKMPGRMGGKNRTSQSLKVLKVVPEENVVLIRGSLPGPTKGWLVVSDAIRKTFPTSPPFPTVDPATAAAATEADAPVGGADPFDHHWDAADRAAATVNTGRKRDA
ncbi:50S ribosomal protein [Thecamonas trahens ATCC 50062]|uniref:Large ribosomal subunit protein uL3m n=1 Tax=Thecamonas trahens ATCC 50062 TaxID=461836 RepID=A0A0L0D5K4_THETB|nr:50S ribosomal protein [Thecamonas trahens ATCC 50062]KNC46578.1 50S ribosomal protein [Thecamonas trahens ATCC 50062]|eukprot:XP_013760355.1 50S ribosomal protein [Thecamonas trahens ATCC 50062]